MPKPIIALDADGVLLDYHAAYRQAWFRAFQVMPEVKDEDAYWPIDRWSVRQLTGQELQHFRSFFDEQFWGTIPAISGAVDACKSLKEAGFDLICVSAIESRFQQNRLENLVNEGFPIRAVIATNGEDGEISPKAKSLCEINPVVFVDDFLPYHRGVPSTIHKALILREINGSPNVGDELKLIDSTHNDLSAFANWWLINGNSSV
ncbi:HAD family hydrolase [Undibacterium sp.]|uniref:HAD family hydrolase n=1 Tax=Undibacterium sp. TaxID=1914977 RepID=UPI00375396E4